MLGDMNSLLRILLPAVLAGITAGLVASLLHYMLTEPLLGHLLGEVAGQREGLRHWVTIMLREVPPTILQATALMALWQWRNLVPDWRQGVAWGMAGFVAAAVLRFVLLPQWAGVPALPPGVTDVPAELQGAMRWAILLCGFLTWLVLGLSAARACQAAQPRAGVKASTEAS
jgi:predicted cobalt transporter CbtA